MESETLVIFRKWLKSEGSDIIALFPYDPADYTGYHCDSYEHIGQHGGASPEVVQRTALATPEEYAALKHELESEPYNYVLKVGKRMPSDAMKVRREKIAGQK